MKRIDLIGAGVPAAWPKILPVITSEQARISDDFMQYWHEILPKRYGIVDNFNHRYVLANASRQFVRTLEIGAGLGEHLAYEKLSALQKSNYIALELRSNMVTRLNKRFPEIQSQIGDCQQRLEFPDGYFDRILAIHVLEHLPNLPAAVTEMHRLCSKDGGTFSVVIPCEGSMAYWLARRISAQRLFEKRYQQSYRWMIDREHLNVPGEILRELEKSFIIEHRSFFPLWVPFVFCNLCLGITLRPR
jgi:ubiquinone/menaquinone biosynthesis C-methylase UbiE